MSDTAHASTDHAEATHATTASPKHTIVFAVAWVITQVGIFMATLHYASYDQVYYLQSACADQGVVQDIWLTSHLVEYPLLYTWPVTVSAWLSGCDFLLFTVVIRIIALGVATLFTACLIAINYAGNEVQ